MEIKKKLFSKVTKLPDANKEVITFSKNGKRNVETVTVKDRYLVTFENGNSVAITSKDFSEYGINGSDIQKSFVKEPDISQKVKENVAKVAENLENAS